MAQHDMNIANQGFPAFRSDLNDALAALVSNSSGATAPSTTFAHQMWVDTAADPSILKIRNADNDAWITIGQIDQTGDKFNLTCANATISENLTLNAQGDLRFADSDSSNWVAFQAPATVSSNVTWTLPSADGTSGQALTTDGSGTLSWAAGSPDSGYNFRNRIINGDMRIDQRNAGASLTVNDNAPFYPVDRWQAFGQSGDGVFTVQRSTTAPTGFNNSVIATVTTADASIGSTQTYLIRQRIEGFNFADLGFGTASAKTVTASFWVRSSLTGTFGGALVNGGSDRSNPFTYTISVADTWEYKTVTITGDTTGTWSSDNSTGAMLTFSLGTGTSRLGTPGTWAAVNYQGATGQVNPIGTLNATWYVTGVQLEVGSVATPFERRPYGTELMLCQRYYYKIFPGVSQDVFCMAYMSDSTNYIAVGQFPVELRTSPSALEQSGTASHYASNNGLGTFTNNAVPAFSGRTSQVAFQVNNGVASGLTGGQATSFISNNDAAYLAWSAEL